MSSHKASPTKQMEPTSVTALSLPLFFPSLRALLAQRVGESMHSSNGLESKKKLAPSRVNAAWV